MLSSELWPDVLHYAASSQLHYAMLCHGYQKFNTVNLMHASFARPNPTGHVQLQECAGR